MSTTTTGRRPAAGPTSASLLDRHGHRPRRRIWPLVLIIVLVLALAGTGVWLVGFSTVLSTQQVEIRGAGVVGEGELRDTAAVPLGVPLARQDIDGVAARVAGLTGVESVEVTRQYPQTVLIAVRERAAVLAVEDVDAYLLLDRFGVAYQRVEKVPAGVLEAELNAGNTDLAVQLGEVAIALPEPLQQKVKRITATSESTIELRLDGGDRVIWGTSDDSDLKATVLDALLKQKGKVYNVSAPRHPSIR